MPNLLQNCNGDQLAPITPPHTHATESRPSESTTTNDDPTTNRMENLMLNRREAEMTMTVELMIPEGFDDHAIHGIASACMTRAAAQAVSDWASVDVWWASEQHADAMRTWEL